MSAAVSSSERGEREDGRRSSDLPPPQLGAPREQLESRRAERRAAARRSPSRRGVDEVEQRVVGPLDILEDEHERALARRSLRRSVAKPRTPPRAAAAVRLVGLESDERAEVRARPAGVGASSTTARDRAARASSPACVVAVGLEDPGLRFHHLGERPEASTPSPYGERATVAPEDELRSPRLDRLEQLVDEAALADAGNADERDELRLAARAHARERPTSSVELVFATDERRARSRREIDAEARRACQRLPDRQPAPSCPSPRSATCLAVLDRSARSRGTWSRRRGSPFVGAAACRRAVVLTTSPAAMPSPASGRAPSVISASPVVTPMRTCSVTPRRAQSRIASAARTAARDRPRARRARRRGPSPRRR